MHDSLLRHSRKRLLQVSIHGYILLSSMYSWFDSLIHEHSHYLNNTIASQKIFLEKENPSGKLNVYSGLIVQSLLQYMQKRSEVATHKYMGVVMLVLMNSAAF